MKLNEIKNISKITPCPIIETAIEIRFDLAQTPVDAIPGLLLNCANGKYSNLKKLPICELPEAIRETDPNLMNAPLWFMVNEENPNIRLQFGKGNISLVCTGEYIGWENFSKHIDEALKICVDAGLITNTPIRLGIRYVSFFENINIFEKLNGKYEIINTPLSEQNTTLRTEFNIDNHLCIANLINTVKIEEKKGSILDLDVIFEDFPQISAKRTVTYYKPIIETTHNLEKKIFFSLLAEDFINKELNPEH